MNMAGGHEHGRYMNVAGTWTWQVNMDMAGGHGPTDVDVHLLQLFGEAVEHATPWPTVCKYRQDMMNCTKDFPLTSK